MARLTRVDPESATPDVKAVFDAALKARGNVPNMFRTMAHRPEILKTMSAHFKAVMADSSVTVRLKELIAVRVSAMNSCDY